MISSAPTGKRLTMIASEGSRGSQHESRSGPYIDWPHPGSPHRRDLRARHPRKPQIEVKTRGPITSITTGADGWSGVVKKIQALRRNFPGTRMPASSPRSPRTWTTCRRLTPTRLRGGSAFFDPEKASYIFALTGQRVRYDALRCTDETAKPGVQATIMSLQMPECKNMLSNRDLALASLRKMRDARGGLLVKGLTVVDLLSRHESDWRRTGEKSAGCLRLAEARERVASRGSKSRSGTISTTPSRSTRKNERGWCPHPCRQ